MWGRTSMGFGGKGGKTLAEFSARRAGWQQGFTSSSHSTRAPASGQPHTPRHRPTVGS